MPRTWHPCLLARSGSRASSRPEDPRTPLARFAASFNHRIPQSTCSSIVAAWLAHAVQKTPWQPRSPWLCRVCDGRLLTKPISCAIAATRTVVGSLHAACYTMDDGSFLE